MRTWEREALLMIKKRVLRAERIRRIERGFSFIPHRFLTDGFLSSLDQKELLLYFFLVLVSDRQGLSFYSYEAICSLLQLSADDYIRARDALIEKDLIAFDGTLFQVLDLPPKPPSLIRREGSPHQYEVRSLIRQALEGEADGR
jgi:hypothetical protein